MKKQFFSYVLRKNFNPQKRVKTLAIIALICAVAVIIRYAWLGILPSALHAKLVDLAKHQFYAEITLAPNRANIVDRNGRILAVSVPRMSIFILTKLMPSDDETLEKVAKQLRLPASQLKDLRDSPQSFVWLYRRMSINEFAALGSLKKWQRFIGVEEEPKRVYPENELAAQLIGFVGSDNVGLSGIEKTFNARLSGGVQKVDVMHDAMGRIVTIRPNEDIAQKSNPPLRLTLDVNVQRFAQEALDDQVKKSKAIFGSVVVMDVTNGELLAIASSPAYDLNKPPLADFNAMRFHPLMDAIEMGSVFKPLLISRAMDLGFAKPEEQIWTNHGVFPIPGGQLHDDTKKFGFLSPSEVITYSSNIGTYLIMRRLGRDLFYHTMVRSGLNRFPGTGLPGEWGGRVLDPEHWAESRFANMAFGQGIATSPLQLAHSLCIVSGGGIDNGIKFLMPPENSKAEEEVGPPIRYLEHRSSSKFVINAMKGVVENAKLSQIPGVDAAGKTGTAQIYLVERKAYSHKDLIASFEGVFPADNPRFAIVVSVYNPHVGVVWGATIATPVFSSIGQKMAAYYNSKGGFFSYSTAAN